MRKNWTSEELNKAKKMYEDGKSVEYIAEAMGRSKNGIESKFRKTGIIISKNVGKSDKSGSMWREKDLEELKFLVDRGYTAKQLAERFGRSEMAIIIKVNKLGKQIKKSNRTWKEDDIEQFKKDWLDPELSIPRLKVKYNRTWFGLRKRAQVLGLGPRRYNDSYLNINTICEEMNVSRDRVHHWIKIGLETKKNKSGKTVYLIDQDDLIEFLEQHQNLFDASLISDYMFLEEPQWLIDKRIADKQKHDKNRKIEYTNEEDKIIQNMFKNGKSDEEIGVLLNRTATAITARRHILGLSKQSYQDYEIEILREFSDKLTIYELAKKLPLRKPKGIMYKCEQLGLPYHTSKAKCKKD